MLRKSSLGNRRLRTTFQSSLATPLLRMVCPPRTTRVLGRVAGQGGSWAKKGVAINNFILLYFFFAATPEPGEDPRVTRAKYFIRDEFLVSRAPVCSSSPLGAILQPGLRLEPCQGLVLGGSGWGTGLRVGEAAD